MSDRATSSDESLPLFREEALKEQQERWLGPILLEPRLSPIKFQVVILLLLIVIAAIAATGTYTRKARVSGWIVPDQGLLRIMAPYNGVVSELFVSEGDRVNQGQPLLVVSAERTNEAGDKLGEVLIQSIAERRDAALRERELQKLITQQQLTRIRDKHVNLEQQSDAIERELTISRKQHRLANRLLPDRRRAFKKGLITREQLAGSEDDVLQKSAAIERLLQQSATVNRELQESAAELESIPVREEKAQVSISRRISQLNQELAEVKSRQSTVVNAPKSGLISSIQVETASTATNTVPLMTIVPEGSLLEAHLYGPSRSIGLIKLNDKAYIRYDSFPFQRFGIYKGHVQSISRSALAPAELPPQLSALQDPILKSQALYKVVVSLDKQSVANGSQSTPLQAGMTLNAEIAIESRKAYRWLLQPILSSWDEEA